MKKFTRLFVLLFVFASHSSIAQERSEDGVSLGEFPPDYLGRSDNGGRVLLSTSDGRIRVVSFWASWCAPCLMELPVLNAIQRQAGSDRIQVIAVNFTETAGQYSTARKAYKDFEILFVRDRSGRVAEKFGISGIPHMLIIDADSRVIFRHIGYKDAELEKIVAELNYLLVKDALGVEPERLTGRP